MTPGPSLEELITTVRNDAGSDAPLDQLRTASVTVAEIEAVADAVLGHFVDQCRRRGHSWSEISGALGVTKQAAHKRFSLATATLDRFTQRARSTLRAAAEGAHALGHGYVGTEHILLGLFEPSEGIAAQILQEAGITQAMVEEKTLEVTPRGSSAVDDPPLTPRAARAIELAVAEALSLGHNYVGTEHLVLALFDDTESLATRILADLGADRDRFRASVIEKLSGYMTR